jgi:hypothetical protein
MKKLMFIVVPFLLMTIYVNAQSQYEAGMQKAFGLWQEGKATASLAMFERIGQAENENWVPLYHAANLLISTSFDIEDANERNTMLEKAKSIIEKAHKRSADNSELLTLEGLLYTAYVAMDPGTYGMMFSAKIMELHNKAIALDPGNPRAHANKIEYAMGSARFFGQDLAPFCEQMKAIIPKFDEQQSDVPFAPEYGKERAIQIANSCDE